MSLFSEMQKIGFNSLLDIAIMAMLIYAALLWLKQTRAAFVLAGMVIVAVLYLLARQFNLLLISSVFENFFGIIIIALVVIFQEEFRRLFERIAVWSMNQRLALHPQVCASHKAEADIILRVVGDFARERIGALLVLRGKDMLDRHLDGGVECQGKLSEPLLKSLFDPHSAGHDGAVIIENNCLTQFAAHLPLSKQRDPLQHHGTRHAAALGLSELTDALCLVVSEESGSVSLARQGVLEEIHDLSLLPAKLDAFYSEIRPTTREPIWRGLLRSHTAEKVIALGLAIGLWFVLVMGGTIVVKTYAVPIRLSPLPKEWQLNQVSPAKADVTFLGPRRSFYLIRPDAIRLLVNPALQEKIQSIPLSSIQLTYPTSIRLQDIEPSRVKIRLQFKPEQPVPQSNKNQD